MGTIMVITGTYSDHVYMHTIHLAQTLAQNGIAGGIACEPVLASPGHAMTTLKNLVFSEKCKR